MAKKDIDLVLGTMTIGDQVSDEGQAKKMLDYFFDQGYHKLDTAMIYNDGKTQLIMGKVLSSEQKKQHHIASKVNNFIKPALALTAESIFAQVDTMLKDLKVDQIDLLYIHWPDRKTPLEETLGAINDLHKKGKFKEFGLSNFAAWEVVYVYHLCKTNGWILPTVYQGMYNAITRDVEKELFPALRCLKMKFYAYNPLAGGLLTGKYKFQEGGAQEEGRFKSGAGPIQNRYIARYWKKDIFDALSILSAACAKHNITETEASLRWIKHHSQLVSGDTVIVGASRMEQLVENIKYYKNEEHLPEDIVTAFDAAWETSKPVVEQYWR